MASSIDYRGYMDECLRAAAKAKSEDERRSFLQLAQTWHQAATRLEADKLIAETGSAVQSVRQEQMQETKVDAAR